jgi:hypothetical protein
MKKVLLIGGLAIVALSSCKKTRSCECNTTISGMSVKSAYTVEGTKNDAKTACGTYETQLNGIYSISGGSATCELK